MYVQAEFEFEGDDEYYGKTVEEEINRLYQTDVLIYSYNDGSVNNEFVMAPINWNDWKILKAFIPEFSSAIMNVIDYDTSIEKAGFHITFTLGKHRDKSFKRNYFKVIDVVYSNYPALVWLSTVRVTSRPFEYRYLTNYYNRYFTKADYPAVLIPSYSSSGLGHTQPKHHKIEFRIPDINYEAPEWILFLIDPYKQIVIKPTHFINRKGASTKPYRMFHTITAENRKKLAGDIVWLLKQLLKRQIQPLTKYIAEHLIEHLEIYPEEIIVTEKTKMYSVKSIKTDRDRVNRIRNIMDTYGESESVSCEYCDARVHRDDAIWIDDRVYCSDTCATDDGWVYINRDWYHEDEVSWCDYCGEPFIAGDIDAVITDDEVFCDSYCAERAGYEYNSNINEWVRRGETDE